MGMLLSVYRTRCVFLVLQQLSIEGDEKAYFCTSSAVPLKPLHNNIISIAMVTKRKNRVRVRKFHMMRKGGMRLLADFQVMPPLTSSMLKGREDRRANHAAKAFRSYAPRS